MNDNTERDSLVSTTTTANGSPNPEFNRLAVDDSRQFGMAQPAPMFRSAWNMGAGEETDLNPRQVLAVFFRRWKIMLATFLTVVLSVAAYTFTTTPIYQAEALVELEQSNGSQLGNFDAAMPFLTEMMGANQQVSQDTEAVIIRSSTVQDAAVLRLAPQQRKSVDPTFVTVATLPHTNLLKISAKNSNPKTAATHANAVCDAYIDRSLKKARGQVGVATDYVRDQLVIVRRDLDRARTALRQFKEKNNTVDPGAESLDMIKRLGDIESELKMARAEYAGQMAQAAKYAAMSRGMASNIESASTIIVPQYVTDLRARLSQLELERGQLLVTYQPTSRKVRDIDRQIAAVRQQLRKPIKRETQISRQDPNPVRMSIIQKQAEAEGMILAAGARSQALQQASNTLRGQLGQLPGRQARLSQLMSDLTTEEQTYALLSEKHQTLKLSENARQANAEVIEKAKVPIDPIKPRKLINLSLAIVMGLVLAVLLAAVVERLDDRVHSGEEASDITQLPVLAYVPLVEGERDKMLVSTATQNPLLREAFRMLRTNISFMAIDAPIRSMVVTSTQPGEGKSISSVNLAITAAQGGEQVILVDCDLRRPSLHRIFDLTNKVGFTSVVSGASSLEDALQQTNVPNLRVLTSGPVPPDSFALLKSRAGRACFQQLAEAADFVVLDTPPALVMTDAQLVASVSDAVLFVVSTKEASKRDVARTRDLLTQTGASVLGILFNKMSAGGGGYYGYYKYQNYSHYFDSQEPSEDDEHEPTAAIEEAHGSSNGNKKA